MMPSGLPTPMGGGAQSVPASLLRSNSGMLGAQNGQLPSQGAFSSLVSSRAQFNNMNMLGNVGNVPSLLNQSLVNGLSVPGANFHGGVDTGAQSVALSGVNNGMGFHTSSSYVPSNLANPGSGQLQGQQLPTSSGNQVMLEQQQNEQLETQNFQPGQQSMRQFSATNNSQQQQQQQQLQPIRGGLSGVEQVKLESQMSNDQQGQQQLQSLRSLASVKMEPQQIQTMRSLGPVKMERQHSNQSFLQQQQQQQQHQLLLSRQSSQAAAAQINLLHRQRLLQMQQQHQQQLPLTGLSQQHSPLQQQLQQQNLQMRSPMKPVYKPGTCARRLTNYMYQQQHRPEENNIEFWRKFVAEYFAPNAKKKWCVSMYGSGRQTNGVFPQDVWHCEICNRKPGRGFEATMEVLPRLFKIKYESGTLEELLYVDMPREYQNSSGQIVLDYAKAIQESVFEQLRVVREGQLRIVFSPDLKIFSWEFCARRHEELIPRRLLIPQVSQLGAATQKYQAATQNASSSLATLDLKNNCNIHSSISISCQSPTLTRRRFDTRLQSSWTAEFVSSARQLAKALEVPLVNDLGYTKRYVRCLQISEVVNCMKDLIDYSRDTGTGPMESLAKFTRTTSASAGFNGQTQQSEQQLQHQQQQRQQLQNLHQQNTTAQHGNNDQNSAMLTASNGIANAGTSVNAASTATASSIIVERLLHQNSMNPVQQTTINNASSPYGGSSMQALSPGSSITIPQAQSVPSPFHSPTPSSSNNPPQPSHSGVTAGNKMNSTNSPANISMQQPSVSVDADPRDSQSSVQKVIQELMSNQLSGSGALVGPGSLGNTVNINGILPSSSDGGLNDGNCLVGNGAVNSNSGMAAAGFSAMGGRLGQSAMINGIRAAMGNNSVVNGRVGVMSMTRDQSVNQQDLSNQLLDVLGTGNGFNNLQFDWKPSP